MEENLIYRFRSLNKVNLHREVRALRGNQLWFSEPASLNDCQEFMLNIRFTNKSHEINEYWKKAVTGMSKTGLTTDQFDQLISSGQIERILRSQITHDVIPKTRTCSFSKATCPEGVKEPINNAMMWGHYTNALEGFALGFDKEILCKSLRTRYINFSSRDVRYNPSESALLEVNFAEVTGPNKVDLLLEPLLINKSDDWKYEQEYRLILAPKDDNENLVSYPPEALRRIVIGSKLSISQISELHGILPEHVAFFVAQKSMTHYRVEVTPFDRAQLDSTT